MSEFFEIDGMVHTRGDEDCESCRPTPCLRGCSGLVHYQGVYGGLVRECDKCGWPDTDVPRPNLSPERVKELNEW